MRENERCESGHSAQPLRSLEDALDPSTIEELRSLEKNGSPGLVARVIQAFLESSQELVYSMRNALSAADAIQASRAAHTLKSSSAQVGAHSLSVRCNELEALAIAGSLENARPLVAAIGEELETLQRTLAGCSEVAPSDRQQA